MAVNMQGTVFTLARLKIVSAIKNLICRCFFMNAVEIVFSLVDCNMGK